MPALNFHSRFAAAVAQGEKRQDVRLIRGRRPIVVGDTLRLYVGQRPERRRLLREAECLGVVPIVLDMVKCEMPLGDGEVMPYFALRNFARNDGFASIDDFFEWFRKWYGDRFEGVLIQW